MSKKLIFESTSSIYDGVTSLPVGHLIFCFCSLRVQVVFRGSLWVIHQSNAYCKHSIMSTPLSFAEKISIARTKRDFQTRTSRKHTRKLTPFIPPSGSRKGEISLRETRLSRDTNYRSKIWDLFIRGFRDNVLNRTSST